MSSGWKLLRHASPGPSYPTLLVKYEFGSTSYKIWLTDLTHIWIEDLKQRPLIQRAWDIDSDIDPVESDQRQMLLRHIQDSLDERDGTKVAVLKEQGLKGILLIASSALPEPLKPLKWPIHLSESSQVTLTHELLIPLLAERLVAGNQIASLLNFLDQKDHVIDKLTDKVQAEGIELRKVFPSAIASKFGRKASSREELGKSVPGLGVFNEHQWRSQFVDDQVIPGRYRDLLFQSFAQGRALASSGINEQVEHGAWWERLDSEERLAEDEREDSPQASIHDPIRKENQAVLMASNLDRPTEERQSSPEKTVLPHRGSNPQNDSPETLDGGSTTDTSDDDLGSVQPIPIDREQRFKSRTQLSSSTNSSSPEPAREASKNTSPKPKGLLGRIGGAPKANISPSKPKLGQVGATHSRGQGSLGPPKAQLTERVESPVLIRESSPDRANRKRDQLKRELEEKSKIGLKKKRKF
ncbi:MAG: hypothetical protein Q9166_003119 [cf. Caloplaca sp. 2 TL-2023]